MEEPPILPSSDAQPPADDGEANPFAPTVSPAVASRVSLSAAYWMLSLVGVGIFSAALFVAPGLGVMGLFAVIGGIIRVPLLQRRWSLVEPTRQLAKPEMLLLTSGVFTLAMGCAAMVAFCVICIPTSIVFLSANAGEDVVVATVFGVSGLIAAGMFFMLYFFSLRLPV